MTTSKRLRRRSRRRPINAEYRGRPPSWQTVRMRRARCGRLGHVADRSSSEAAVADPVTLLIMVSELYALDDDRSATEPTGPDIAELVDVIVHGESTSTRAMAFALSRMFGGPDLQVTVDQKLGAAIRGLPDWLRALDRTEPTQVVCCLEHDLELLTLAIGIRFADDAEATLLVDVDLGRVDTLIDLTARNGSVVEITRTWSAAPHAELVEITPADARAQVESAIQWREFHPRDDHEDWHRRRALAEWVLAMLPGGGRPVADRWWGNEVR